MPILIEPWITLTQISANLSSKIVRYKNRIKRTPIVKKRIILGAKIRGLSEAKHLIDQEAMKENK